MKTVFEEKFNSPEKLAKAIDVATYACDSARRHLSSNDNMCRNCGLVDICGATQEEMITYFNSEIN